MNAIEQLLQSAKKKGSHQMDTIDHLHSRRGSDLPGADDPVLHALEEYWKTLRHAQRIPARNDLVPSKIDHVLPYAFILQRVAPGIARFRVAGQKLHSFLKMDARGMPFTTLFEAQSRDQIQDLVEQAFAEPAIVGLSVNSSGTLLRPEINGSMLLLPMRDHQGTTTRLLGALVTPPHNGNRPRRFTISQNSAIRHEPLGMKIAATQIMPHASAGTEKPDVTRPALRLVVNNS